MPPKALPAKLDFGTLFTDAVELYGDVELDLSELASGAVTAVPVPGQIVVGTTGGKVLYLVGSITTVKPA
jgi:hypothetical protein